MEELKELKEIIEAMHEMPLDLPITKTEIQIKINRKITKTFEVINKRLDEIEKKLEGKVDKSSGRYVC